MVFQDIEKGFAYPVSVNVALPLTRQVAFVGVTVMACVFAIPDSAKNTELG